MRGPGLRLALVDGPGGRRACRVVHGVFPAVEGLLRGMPVGTVAQAVRRLHGLCRAAQGLAADLAIAAATGATIAPQEVMAAWRQAEMEAVCEIGMRLCLDWPLLIGETPRTQEARLLVMLTRAGDVAGLARWLADIEGQGLPMRVVDAAPPALVPAFERRLADLRRRAAFASADDSLPRGHSPARGLGEASVQCARGRLTHHVLVERGRLVDYRIDAPTARRFAAGGDAAALLAGCGDARAVDWAMQAIDPCVGWRLDEAVEMA